MDFAMTYDLGEGFTRGAFRAKEVGDVLGGNDIALTSGSWCPPAILRFRQYEGKKWLDCVGTQRANVKFVSESVVATLRAVGASGWGTYPVRLESEEGTEVTGYSGLIVSGRCGAIDNTRSVQVDKAVVGNPRGHAPVWRGLYFAEESWDGSDIFRPSSTGYIFVTEKVRAALDGAKVTNLSFTALANFERAMLF
jgi:hypothetical protein